MGERFVRHRRTTRPRVNRRPWVPAATAALIVGASWPAANLDEGHALLRAGEPDAALAVYEQIEERTPDSPALQFAIGCAHFMRAFATAENGDAGAALDGFTTARDRFARVLESGQGSLEPDALYNQATAAAYRAEMLDTTANRDGTLDAIREAVDLYEALLERYPDYAAAARNLQRVRFLWKQVLARREQPALPGGADGTGDEEKGRKESPAPPGDNQSDEPPRSGGESAAAMPQDTNPAASAAGGPPEGRNVEALLESLEDIDAQAQRARYGSPEGIRVRREWW